MTITGGTALGKDDINQMIKDAEAHAEEDRRKREEAETRNTADQLSWQTENLLKEQGDKVPLEDRQKIEEGLQRLKDALAGTDIDAVKSAHESLLTASNEFTRRLYENVQAQQASAAGGGGAGGAEASQPSDDEVADAEIVDDDQQSA
jgi:molecular chaperone DnaK